MGNAILTECRACDDVVAGDVLAQYCAVVDRKAGVMNRFTFSRCPRCDSPLLTAEQFCGNQDDREVWSQANRLYPPHDEIGARIPRSVRTAFAEAMSCFNAQAYSAATMMCRQTLDAACADLEVEASSLRDKLAALADIGLVDDGLLEWADVLAISDAEATRTRARDVLDLTNAVLSYVYGFRQPVDEFRARRAVRPEVARSGLELDLADASHVRATNGETAQG